MSASRHETLARVFAGACDLSGAAREAYLERACGSDAALRAAVRELLAADSEPGGAIPWERPVGALQPPRTELELELMGEVLAGRYRIDGELGEGAHGRVWLARDLFAEEDVAIKVLFALEPREASRVRREVAALRLLRLPGVVRLRDEGTWRGAAFLVMDLVRGTPFPGAGRAGSWAAIEGAVTLALETLARVHAAGVVHRDLKPDNMLVDAAGRPTLLDLGVARGPGVGREGRLALGAGTPAYMAPEALLGEPSGPRADLYSLGVMIHEALSGQRPHDAASLDQLARARLEERPASLEQLAPGTPAPVVRLVGALLEPLPEARPRSAAAALELLTRDGARPNPERRVRLPAHLVDAAPLDAVALRELFAGRDRLFHTREDAARELWARTGGQPDQVERELDAWLRAEVARREGERVVLEAGGLERLRAGLATGIGSYLCDLEQRPALDPDQRRLVAIVELAWPHGRREVLARALGQPVGALGAQLEELERRGALVLLGDGRVRARVAGEGVSEWPDEERRAVHGALAEGLEVGHAGRLYHLVGAGRDGEIVAEALALAGAELDRDRPEGARAALDEGLIHARRLEDAFGEELLLVRSLELALELGTSPALNHALYQVARAEAYGEVARAVEDIARAALAALESGWERGLELADGAATANLVSLAGARHAVRVVAARRGPLELEERVVNEAVVWARSSGDAHGEARADGWLGWLRYRQGNFVAAARHHQLAADSSGLPRHRVPFLLYAASALLEGFELERARELAARAVELLGDSRHPHHEARAEWILRAAAYRAGEDLEPDLELVEAVGELGVANLEGMVALGEAAVAWRGRREDLARRLAERATRTWKSAGRTEPCVVPRALALLCGAPVGPGEIDELARRALAHPAPSFGLQALGLLALAEPGRAAELRELARQRSADLDPGARRGRLEVLSLAEVLG